MSINGTIIKEDGFGVIPIITDDHRSFDIVKRYTLTNKTKASVTLITWGAGIQSIRVPNNKGILGDVVLGFDDIDGYWKNRHIGRMLGRVTRRLSNEMIALFSSNTHDRNNNHQSTGFDNVNWDGYILDNQVVMSYLSKNEDPFASGDVLAQVKYGWNDENELLINMYATCTRRTPVDVTPFCLFNLAGHSMGPDELKKHVVSINANKWLHSDVQTKLPTGAIRSVDNTWFDLRNSTELNIKRLDMIPGGGYDHFYCVNGPSRPSYRFHARVLHPETGRFLEVSSDQPGLHFYTANDFPYQEGVDYWDSGESFCKRQENLKKDRIGLSAKGGALYKRHGGFSISPRNFPDSMNFSHFPSNFISPGWEYCHNISFKFGTK